MVQAGDVLYTIDSADAANGIERAQLALNQAQRTYEDAVNAQYVRTDIEGTVVSIKVAPGDAVAAGQEVAVIRDDATVLLTLQFPAADAAGFSAGQTAQVTLDGTYESLNGTVRSVSGTDTLSSGNLLVRSGGDCRPQQWKPHGCPGCHRLGEWGQRAGLSPVCLPEGADPDRCRCRHGIGPLRQGERPGRGRRCHCPAFQRKLDPADGNRVG